MSPVLQGEREPCAGEAPGLLCFLCFSCSKAWSSSRRPWRVLGSGLVGGSLGSGAWGSPLTFLCPGAQFQAAWGLVTSAANMPLTEVRRAALWPPEGRKRAPSMAHPPPGSP